jgi:tRNA A-37 threonylcarbamoyl transferase component Bud32
MRPTAAQCPSEAALSAFALGKLDHSATEWIGRHLADCPACRAVVEQAPADSLVHRLRGEGAGGVSSPLAVTPSRQGSATSGGLPPPAPAVDPNDLPPALRDHPRYRIVRQLGQGGMGVVYQAEHKIMDRLVAVKVIIHTLLDSPEAAERFTREVKAAAKLDHPNIVRAFDAEQAGELQLLAMEYVEGRSLADVLAKKGPLPVAHACHYARQAALGLQHAHERGMVHRDIKPHNLMLTAKGVVKILDFGLAKVFSERRTTDGLTRDNAMMGTPEYIAPEQAQDTKAADIRADIYSLGCTLFCLLAGRPPFTGGDWLAVVMAHLQEPPPPLEGLRPEVPPGLAAVVARMLAKDPAQRPQTPMEVAEALAPFVKAEGAKLVPTQTPDAALPRAASEDNEGPPDGRAARESRSTRTALPPAGWRRRRVLVGAALGVLLTGGVVAGIVVVPRSAPNPTLPEPPVPTPASTDAAKVAKSMTLLHDADKELTELKFPPEAHVKRYLKQEARQDLEAAIQAIGKGQRGQAVQAHFDRVREKLQGLDDRIDPAAAKKAKGKSLAGKNQDILAAVATLLDQAANTLKEAKVLESSPP